MFFGDGVNSSLGLSSPVLTAGVPVRLIVTYTDGDAYPKLWVNGVRQTLVEKSLNPPAATHCSGPAGNSFIGNVPDIQWPAPGDHYVRDLSSYSVALTTEQVMALDAYLAGA